MIRRNLLFGDFVIYQNFPLKFQFFGSKFFRHNILLTFFGRIFAHFFNIAVTKQIPSKIF